LTNDNKYVDEKCIGIYRNHGRGDFYLQIKLDIDSITDHNDKKSIVYTRGSQLYVNGILSGCFMGTDILIWDQLLYIKVHSNTSVTLLGDWVFEDYVKLSFRKTIFDTIQLTVYHYDIKTKTWEFRQSYFVTYESERNTIELVSPGRIKYTKIELSVSLSLSYLNINKIVSDFDPFETENIFIGNYFHSGFLDLV